MSRDTNTIGTPIGTRCQRIIRLAYGWRVWLATADYRFGTFLELHDDGRVVRFVVRDDQGDDIAQVRPSDIEIAREGNVTDDIQFRRDEARN